MSKTIELEQQFHMNTYNRLPVVFVEGKGAYLYDEKGREYLDFVSGLGVTSLGHSNPVVIKAAERQLNRLTHVSNLFYTKPQTELAQKLVEISLKKGKVFFANSGAEANEAAVKLTRRWAKAKGKLKPEIITAYNSFHGRTLKMLAATGQKDKQKPFEPLPPGFKHVKFNDFGELKKAVNSQTAAIMLEVIQGEGGVYCADKDYLKKVAQLCKEKHLLLILDEVQTGIGRTGKFFAYQHFGVEPDVLTVAKALGNGLPIGAAIANNKVAAAFQKGDHGSTFGGGPVVCSAAIAVLDAIQKRNLTKKATDLGEYICDLVQKQLADFVVETRGFGLMLGFKTKNPIAGQITKKALEKGLIINNIGENTIRLLPPLIISKKDCDKAVGILKECFEFLKN